MAQEQRKWDFLNECLEEVKKTVSMSGIDADIIILSKLIPLYIEKIDMSAKKPKQKDIYGVVIFCEDYFFYKCISKISAINYFADLKIIEVDYEYSGYKDKENTIRFYNGCINLKL